MAPTDNGPPPRDTSPHHDQDADWMQVAQRHFVASERGELTTAIVRAVAEAEGVAMEDITSPLYEHIDAPALEDTFFGRDVAGESRRGTGRVKFEYVDYLVRIGSDGWIQVYERAETDRPG